MDATVKPWCDDQDTMLAYTENLTSFHTLLKERRATVDALGKSSTALTSYIVRGSWHLDQYGQVGYIIPNDVHHGKSRNYAPIDLQPLRVTNSILTSDEFIKWLGSFDASYSWGAGGRNVIPHDSTPCAQCLKNFTMEDAHTCVGVNDSEVLSMAAHVGKTLKEIRDEFTFSDGKTYHMREHTLVRNDRWIDLTLVDDSETRVVNKFGWSCALYVGGRAYESVTIDWNTYVIQEGDECNFDVITYYHAECMVDKHTGSHRRQCLVAFDKAGIQVHGNVRIKNEYGSEAYRGQWLIFDTDKGYFCVGWRKRVITCQKLGIMKNGWAEEGKSKHLDNYDALAVHLKFRFNAVTTGPQIDIFIKSAHGGRPDNFQSETRGYVEPSIAAIEDYLSRIHRYDFNYNAIIKITVGPKVDREATTADWHAVPSTWLDIYPVMADGNVIGCVTAPVTNEVL